MLKKRRMRHMDETPIVPKQQGVEFGIFTGEGIYENVVDKAPIIDGLLNEVDNLIISAVAGTGKSILALQLLFSLTTGKPFLDTLPINGPKKVLFVQTEGDRAETLHRITRMRNALELNDDNWAHYNAIGIPLNTAEGLGEFMRHISISKMRFDVAIIDPLYATIKGSINDDAVAGEWQRSIRIMRSRLPNLALILFHHESSKISYDTKGRRIEKGADDIMGTSMWGAWATANYKMHLREDGIRVFLAGKGDGYGRTGQGVSEMHLRLIEPNPLYFVPDDTNLTDTETLIKNKIFDSLGEKFTRKQLEIYAGKSKATVCRALVQLLKQEKITKMDEEGVVYYIKKTYTAST